MIAPLDCAPTDDTPTRASRTAYIAGLVGTFIFGLLLGALLVSA
jgi:tetrahydromethanopterin S-methyltransferase subunit B